MTNSAQLLQIFAQAELASLSNPWLSQPLIWLLVVVMVLLIAAWVAGIILRRQPESVVDPAVIRMFHRRVVAWWVMFSILSAGYLLGLITPIVGYVTIVVLFGLVSFWALREFITMTPTRRSDHRALFWTFILLTPLQYVIVGMGAEWYGVYTIMIPVYASLFIPARIAFSGDPKRFLERSAKIQFGLLICVFALSHAPALLDLKLQTRAIAEETSPLDGFEEPPAPQPELNEWRVWQGSNAGLLFYLVLVAQVGDVLQYLWGKLLGRRVIAEDINASRTWEGFIGGLATTSLFGGLLWWVTPFTLWGSCLMSLVIAVMGFCGGMTMSAIKRDRGVRDTGTLVTGHAGILDRIDSICFAAPVFFHLTKIFMTGHPTG